MPTDMFTTLNPITYETFLSYREVAHPHWVLEEAFEAGGPAGHSLLRDPSQAARSWKTAITVQAALAAASLQLDSTVVCGGGGAQCKG